MAGSLDAFGAVPRSFALGRSSPSRERLASCSWLRARRPTMRMIMFDVQREVLDWGGRRLVLETGKVARQADGAVLATMATPRCSPPSSPPRHPSPASIHAAHRELPGEGLRGGPHPRRLLSSARAGPPKRKCWSPASSTGRSAAVHRWLALRHAGDRHRASHDLENDPDIVAMVAASAR